MLQASILTRRIVLSLLGNEFAVPEKFGELAHILGEPDCKQPQPIRSTFARLSATMPSSSHDDAPPRILFLEGTLATRNKTSPVMFIRRPPYNRQRDMGVGARVFEIRLACFFFVLPHDEYWVTPCICGIIAQHYRYRIKFMAFSQTLCEVHPWRQGVRVYRLCAIPRCCQHPSRLQTPDGTRPR